MTIRVREYMLKERGYMNSLDDSELIKKNTYSEGMAPLEALGVEVAMRASVVRGIDIFVDFDELVSELFKEESDD